MRQKSKNVTIVAAFSIGIGLMVFLSGAAAVIVSIISAGYIVMPATGLVIQLLVSLSLIIGGVSLCKGNMIGKNILTSTLIVAIIFVVVSYIQVYLGGYKSVFVALTAIFNLLPLVLLLYFTAKISNREI